MIPEAKYMFRYEILVDHSETANKCTILPLAYRGDFAIKRVRREKSAKSGQLQSSLQLNSQVLLHPDGIPLDQFIQKRELCTAVEPTVSIAAVDCVWRRLSPILDQVTVPLPPLVSIPSGFVTAYPRTSKFNFDPTGGLATIEALFIAAAMFGNWDESLLREYFFGDLFIQLNTGTFMNFGVRRPTAVVPVVYRPMLQNSSLKRRRSRGRFFTEATMSGSSKSHQER